MKTLLENLANHNVLILSSHANVQGNLIAPTLPAQPWSVQLGTPSSNAVIWFQPEDVAKIEKDSIISLNF